MVSVGRRVREAKASAAPLHVGKRDPGAACRSVTGMLPLAWTRSTPQGMLQDDARVR
jgi:hypothetical protein